MRTKDEILKQAFQVYFYKGESFSVSPETIQQCILEVLLDIREMIKPITSPTMLHGYSCGSGLHSTAKQAARCRKYSKK